MGILYDIYVKHVNVEEFYNKESSITKRALEDKNKNSSKKNKEKNK